MSKALKVEIVRRLVKRGKIFEAEVACDDWGLSRDLIKQLQGEKDAN